MERDDFSVPTFPPVLSNPGTVSMAEKPDSTGVFPICTLYTPCSLELPAAVLLCGPREAVLLGFATPSMGSRRRCGRCFSGLSVVYV